MKDGVNTFGLVGDIGGTNARFASVDLNPDSTLELLEQKTLACAEFANIDAAIQSYLAQSEHDIASVKTASIAVAGAVGDDWFEMTNNHWRFSVKAVCETLGFENVTLLNDFAAIAWSLPTLTPDDWVAIGAGGSVEGAPVAVLGPGTGLGIGGYIKTEAGGMQVLQTEGGHASFAPVDQLEVGILQYLMAKFSRVSSERLLSGPGIENIYAAIAHVEGISQPQRTAAEITNGALNDGDEYCIKVLNQFCSILGSIAGDVALNLGAKGGVYIAGGIVPRFIDFLQQSPFRQRFEAKGRFEAYNASIFTRIVTAEQPGLLGAAAHERAVKLTRVV